MVSKKYRQKLRELVCINLRETKVIDKEYLRKKDIKGGEDV